MEFLGSIFEIGKNMWEATGKWFGYFNNLDANMQNLKRKIEDLSCQEDDINTELSSAEHKRPEKRRKKEVEVWLRDVQKTKDDVQRLEQEVVGERKYVSRARLGKLVVEKTEEVAELQQKGRFSNGLVIDAPPTRGQLIPTTTLFGESSGTNMERVWAYLMDDEVRRIGVFGMGGVGKTTIMHHIHNRLILNETCNFDNVIWVTVSKAVNVKKIQNKIAMALKNDHLKYEDETRRASELYTMLSQMKSYVLILDDLWEAFPLEKVGIPEPTISNGCKLVSTTRSLEVCRKMECRTVKVELLTEQEALDLFMSKVAHQTLLAPEVTEIATKVAEECARLPLAIITIAGSMRGVNDIHEWRNALNKLISLTTEIRGDESKVFERLKFSYSRLKDEKLQHCFLCCALYPEDHNILREELIGYLIVEGLIDEMKSREAMFDKGHTILNKLENTCLLESSTDIWDEKCVRMHDLIRDMALKITTISPRFMVRAGEGLERVSNEDWCNDLERVSLMCNKIEVLDPPRPPMCPRLTTLLLQDNPLALIQASFFMHMRGLKVLDLSHTRIKSLPESISYLENLHALLLKWCRELEYVPSLAELKALKELNMWGTGIRELPRGIEELINLIYLDLSYIKNIQMFPPLKLCRLSQLQCLTIAKTNVEVSAKELLCLTQLEVLHARFNNVHELTTYVTSSSQQCQRLKNYSLCVGIHLHDGSEKMGKHVSLTDSRLVGRGVDPLLVLPSNIEWLEIERCHDLTSLYDIVSLRDARDLIRCQVKDCNGIESIFSSSSFLENSHMPLTSVESLLLHDLPNLRVLFDRVNVPLHRISFELKELYLCGCPSIKNIFVAAMWQNFPNLERVHVSRCEQLEDIIGGGEEVEMMSSSNGDHHQDDNNIITLGNLRELSLLCLPKLKSVSTGRMVFESLQHICVFMCPMLRRLPLSSHRDGEQASAPSALKSIYGEEGWWESLEWDDPHTKNTLQPLFEECLQR